MQENKYYQELKNIIEDGIVNEKVRTYQANGDLIERNWNIGKLLVEAQGGEKRAKYGDNLIRKWSNIFVEKYGKDYNYREMQKKRKFYLCFPILPTLSAKITWSHIVEILSIKNENERNYYINQIVLNNLSVRELRYEIKNKSFERLSYKDKENIKLITNDSDYTLTIEDMIKDPIIISINKDIDNLSEKIIHKYIIEMLEKKFLELGSGFCLHSHEYKIVIDNKTFKIDLLFFNYELNAFVVVELKIREVHPKDIGQLEFYTEYIDRNIKKNYHNKTIGILIVKKKNKLVVEYITNKDIYVTTFKIES